MARKPQVLFKVKVKHNGFFYGEFKTIAVSEKQAENNVRFNLVGAKEWSEWSFDARGLKSASRQLLLPGIETPHAQLL